VLNPLPSSCEDYSASVESSSDAEVLDLLFSLQLRQENERLRQAVDVMTQAHSKLNDDLTLKNAEISQFEMRCNDLALQVVELSEKLKSMEVVEWKLNYIHGVSPASESPAECVELKENISPCDGDVSAPCFDLDNHAYDVQQKQMTVSDFQELLSAEREKAQLIAVQLCEEQDKLVSRQNDVAAVSAENGNLTAQISALRHKLELEETECSNLRELLNEQCKKASNECEEVQQRLQWLQNDYDLQLQALTDSEGKREALQHQFDDFVAENASCRSKIVDEQAAMQAKIDALERALEDKEESLIVGKKTVEECLRENSLLQKKLLEAETERDRLCSELHDSSSRFHGIESLMCEAQEKMTENNRQIQEKDSLLDCVRQQVPGLTAQLATLQEKLMRQDSAERELKEKINNLKLTVRSQKENISDVLAAKEETDRQADALQLQAEHLTSENLALDQKVRMLEDSNKYLEKNLLMVRDECECEKQLSAQLQLCVDQLRASERSLSEQQSSVRLLCEQKDEMLQQLNSRKEEMCRSIASLKQEAEHNAREKVVYVARITELDEQVDALKEKLEMLSAEKQKLLDDISTCGDLIEQQKQSLSDVSQENGRCLKVISDYEEQSLQWRDEKLHLEARIEELKGDSTSMKREVQALQEKQAADAALVKTTVNVEVLRKNLNNTAEIEVPDREEIVLTLEAEEQKSEIMNSAASDPEYPRAVDSGNQTEYLSLPPNLQEMSEQSEIDKDMRYNANELGKQSDELTETVAVHRVSELDLECGLHDEVSQVWSSKEALSEAVIGNMLRPVLPENAPVLPSQLLDVVDGFNVGDDVSANDRSFVQDSAPVSLNGESSENRRSSSGNPNELSTTEEAVHKSCVSTETATESDVTNTDTANNDIHRERCSRTRVIKRFSRLPQSSAAVKRSSVCNSIVLNLQSQAAGTIEASTQLITDATEQLIPVDESPARKVNDIKSALKLQEDTDILPACMSVVDAASDAACSTAACSADLRLPTEATGGPNSDDGVRVTCLQVVGECSKAANENEDGCPNTEVERVDDSNSSDHKLDCALQLSKKRLSDAVNGNDAKKVRTAGECSFDIKILN